MKIYVINLRRSEERRLAITRQLQKQNLAFEIIEAVDGKQMIGDEFLAVDKNEGMRKQELACLLSHCKAYQKIIGAEEDFGIVMEDDIILKEGGLEELIAQLMEYLEEDKITLLTYYWCREGNLVLRKGARTFRVGDNDYWLCGAEEVWGVARAAAYFISKRTASKIIDFYTRNKKYNADSWIVYYQNGLINGVDCIYPMPIEDNADFASDIGYTQTKMGSLLKNVTYLFTSIPFVQQLLAKRRLKYTARFKKIQLK